MPPDFNDVWHVFQELDADVISIEASKSDLKLLEVFKRNAYANDVGPGVYDIHSPRVPSVEEIKNKIKEFIQAGIRKDRMVVNPDCGLKTRNQAEVDAALTNMVAAAKVSNSTLLSIHHSDQHCFDSIVGT